MNKTLNIERTCLLQPKDMERCISQNENAKKVLAGALMNFNLQMNASSAGLQLFKNLNTHIQGLHKWILEGHLFQLQDVVKQHGIRWDNDDTQFKQGIDDICSAREKTILFLNTTAY